MIDKNTIIPKRISDIKPSGIRKFFDLLNEMDDVISLTVGEPDFVTPQHIRDAAITSLEGGKTYYTGNSGMPALRESIAEYLNRRFSLDYSPKDELIVTVGGSEAIDLAVRAIVDTDDEVIIPIPSFVCYGPIVELSHGKPVFVETKAEDNFKLTPEALEAAITPKTKMIVIPFPNNPTGAVLTKSELEALARVIEKTNAIVLSDEIYAELTYGFKHTSIASIPSMKDRTILVSGFSKAYAMTGWRLGYLAGPTELVSQMLKIHQYAIMCAPTTSQFAAIEAMKNGDSDIAEMSAEYNRRRKFLVSGLNKIGLDCFEPEGAFYAFPNVGKSGLSSEEFAEKLLYSKKVAIVPGNAFGSCGEGFARISYAYSVKHISLALERLEEFLTELKQGKIK